jgi:predicted amidohydrolase
MRALAQQLGSYVIAPVWELCKDNTTYNTAVLIARNGSTVGTYRKMFPTAKELSRGITPSRGEVAAFDLDFGRVAILICWD